MIPIKIAYGATNVVHPGRKIIFTFRIQRKPRYSLHSEESEYYTEVVGMGGEIFPYSLFFIMSSITTKQHFYLAFFLSSLFLVLLLLCCVLSALFLQ